MTSAKDMELGTKAEGVQIKNQRDEDQGLVFSEKVVPSALLLSAQRCPTFSPVGTPGV